MERVTNHERPGVYSAYMATAAAQRGNRRGVAAVVAVSQKGTAGTLYALGSYRQAAEAFGAEDGLTALVKILLANGAARVLAVPVAEESGYAAAFALVQEQEGVNVVVCDSEKLAVQQKLRDSVMSASAERRERIAVVAGAAGETAEALVKRAGELNSERVVLVAPAVSQEAGGAWVAAAVAGAICGGSDPALPLGGAELQGISALEKRLDESEVDALIRGGVTPVERVGGRCPDEGGGAVPRGGSAGAEAGGGGHHRVRRGGGDGAGGRAGDLSCDIWIYGDPWDGSDLAERRGDGVRKEAVTWR